MVLCGWIVVAVVCGLVGGGCAGDAGGGDGAAGEGEVRSPVVYGEDDRTDVYAFPDRFWRELGAGSVVAIVDASRVVEDDPSDIRFRTRTLGERQNLCEGERFRDQPVLASCSGTLVGDDLVLTAGHCVNDDLTCRDDRFVFGVLQTGPGELGRVTADDVFRCREVVAWMDNGRVDHAIVRLDRIVPTHRPRVRVQQVHAALEEGTPLTVIGFPSGLPMKIDAGGMVTRGRAGTLDYFEASLDTFGGNSGSGVFTDDGTLVGILVRGARAYGNGGGGRRVNRLPEGVPGSEGEACTYASRAVAALCATGLEDPLCGGMRHRWCTACLEDDACEPDGQHFTGVLRPARCVPDPHAQGARICAPPCRADAECRLDHACREGVCVPAFRPQCMGGMLVERDPCGREGEVLDACEDGFCVADACLPRAAHSRCEDAEELPAVTGTVEGELTAAHGADTSGSCAGAGPERVYRFTLRERSFVRFVAGGFDTVLYLRRDCGDADSEVWCNDDRRPGRDLGSLIEGELEAGTYWLFMDAYDERVGEYTLDVEVEPRESTGPACDECRPGEALCDGEGRVATCAVDEAGCPRVTVTVCAANEECRAGICEPRVCAAMCQAGAVRCAGGRQRERCAVDAAGCGAWVAAEPCEPGELCDAATDSCVSPGGEGSESDGGLDEVLDAVRDVEEKVAASCGGCAAGKGRGGAAWLTLLVLLAVCRRRR